MTETLKVLIDAQVPPGGLRGGVEQFVLGLVHALGQLDDGPEEYIIIGPGQEPDWFAPYLGPKQRIVPGKRPQPRSSRWASAKRMLGPMRRPAGELWRGARRLVLGLPPKPSLPIVAKASGFYESFGAEVVHFPHQSFRRCNIPMIFNPHDLQHLHYAQFFTPEQIAWREKVYPAGCRYAQAIAAESKWVRDDIIRQYGIDPEKIYVIPRGSPTELYEPVTSKTLMDVRQKVQLAQTFILYPAQTWAHKNHIRLLEAIKLLRERHGLSINLVCTGRKNVFWPSIEKRLYELSLTDQVRFLGFVSPTELRALYHLAQFVVFPSLFEGGGFPVLEAFREGTPVACSAVTSLPEYGGDAVHLFDPTSVESIAEALRRMTMDAELRAELRQRGTARIRLFTWERTGKMYRALYRKAAGHRISDEDRYLLALACGAPERV
jgi:glycosyltransferase involved in cell wall biosynthesis